jgi:hypothetical protein
VYAEHFSAGLVGLKSPAPSTPHLIQVNRRPGHSVAPEPRCIMTAVTIVGVEVDGAYVRKHAVTLTLD